ncbi:hypothetical protein HZA55_08570 [Candidatus Poribacteria bacterium]|nr:hypothetical protein [Candidatus Poribacteria bacterium]
MKKYLIGLVFFISIIFIAQITHARDEEEQDKLFITIYKNFALVRDIRVLELKKNVNEVLLDNIPQEIEPNSLFIDLINSEIKKKKNYSCQLISQSYINDFVNPDKLLGKYLLGSEKVTIELQDGKSIKNYLLYFDKKNIILGEQAKDMEPTIINRDLVKQIDLPEHKNSIIFKPGFSLKLDCSHKEDYAIAFCYLTRGIKWEVNYTGIINPSDSEVLLFSNVSIKNNSGLTFSNAKLKLASGDVKQEFIQDENEKEPILKSHESISFYDLNHKATLNDDMTNQIIFFDNKVMPLNKVYTYNGRIDHNKVKISLSINNDPQNGFGMELPNGKIKLYKKDDTENLVLIKEESFPKLPIGRNAKISLSDAPDIYAERRQIESKDLGLGIIEKTYEIELKNNQKEQVNVLVTENISANCQVIETSEPYVKIGTDTIEFSSLIPAGEKKVIKCRIKIN